MTLYDQKAIFNLYVCSQRRLLSLSGLTCFPSHQRLKGTPFKGVFARARSVPQAKPGRGGGTTLRINPL